MQGAIVIRWGRLVPGREAQALEVFNASHEFADRAVKDERATSNKVFFSPAGGMRIIEGDVDALWEITRDDEFSETLMRAGAIVQDLDLDFYTGGGQDAVASQMDMFIGAMGSMGYL